MAYTLAQIAHIETDFSEKFGIPRQSGLVEELRARIVFEPEFRSPDAVRGLDGYDYIWLVWQFSTVVQAGQDGTNWRPTVRPPRLGGNKRVGNLLWPALPAAWDACWLPLVPLCGWAPALGPIRARMMPLPLG